MKNLAWDHSITACMCPNVAREMELTHCQRDQPVHELGPLWCAAEKEDKISWPPCMQIGRRDSSAERQDSCPTHPVFKIHTNWKKAQV